MPVPDVCEEESMFCGDDVGALADEFCCRAEDEERRWLLREELDACNSGDCAELDDTAIPAESAELDVAELE